MGRRAHFTSSAIAVTDFQTVKPRQFMMFLPPHPDPLPHEARGRGGRTPESAVDNQSRRCPLPRPSPPSQRTGTGERGQDSGICGHTKSVTALPLTQPFPIPWRGRPDCPHCERLSKRVAAPSRYLAERDGNDREWRQSAASLPSRPTDTSTSEALLENLKCRRTACARPRCHQRNVLRADGLAIGRFTTILYPA